MDENNKTKDKFEAISKWAKAESHTKTRESGSKFQQDDDDGFERAVKKADHNFKEKIREKCLKLINPILFSASIYTIIISLIALAAVIYECVTTGSINTTIIVALIGSTSANVWAAALVVMKFIFSNNN